MQTKSIRGPFFKRAWAFGVLAMALISFAKFAQSQPIPVDWTTFRGDRKSTGAVDFDGKFKKLSVVWKFELKDGGFESGATIVNTIIADPKAGVGDPANDGQTGDGESVPQSDASKRPIVFIAGVTNDVQGKLFAFDLETGQTRWIYDSPEGFLTTPAYADGGVFLGDELGVFRCIQVATGQLRWQFDTQSAINSNANFFKEDVIFGSQNASLYSLNQQTGKPSWTFEAPDQIQSSITVADGHVFLAGCDSQFHVIDVKSGSEKGSVEIGSPTIATPAVLGDVVYFGDENGSFYAIDWRKPELVWSDNDASGASIRSSAAVTAGHVIFGARNRRLYSLAPSDGRENWSIRLKGRIDASPVIMGDRVCAASTDGRLYLIDLESGEKVWEKQFNGAFVGAPAVYDDRIVIATDEGVVYCLSTK